MRWPFVSRRRHERELEYANADRERLRGERNQFADDRDAFKAAVETAARQFEEADEQLAAARKRIAAYGVRRTVSDVLEEHDVHRKALADALGDQKYHLNWDQLIAEVQRLHGACEAWAVDHAAEKRRADLAARARAELAQRLDVLQAAHVADTRELHDLRQGVAS